MSGRSEPTEHPKTLRLAFAIWRRLPARARMSLVAAFLLMFGSAGADAAVPVLIGYIVNDVAAGRTRGVEDVAMRLLLVLAVLVVGQTLAVARRQIVESTSTAFERDSRIESLSHALRVRLGFYRDNPVGALNERVARGVEGSARLLKLMFMDLFPAIIMAAAAAVLSFQAGVWVGIATIGVIPVGLVIVRVQIASQHGIRTTIRNYKESIVALIVGVLPSIATIRTYGAESFVEKDIESASHGVRNAELAHHRAMGFFDLSKFANESVFSLLVLFFAILAFLGGAAPIGTIMASYVLFQKVLAPLREIHRILDESAEASKQTFDLFRFQQEPLDDRFLAQGRS